MLLSQKIMFSLGSIIREIAIQHFALVAKPRYLTYLKVKYLRYSHS